MSSPPGLTDADVTRILHLIDSLHDVEVRIEVEGMKLHVRKFSAATSESAPALPPATAHQPQAVSAPASSPRPPLQPAAAVAAGAAVANRGPKDNPTTATRPAGATMIRAPMLGRFFRAPSPTEPPFVEIGSNVEPDDTVCIIEVMKLFNTVKAGVRGTIAEIVVENGAMVEYDNVLFVVKPL